jgi:CheY-like chemotaxis protein
MKPKVLFIEDDGDQIVLYGKKFGMEGFEFMSAIDGPAGIAAAKEKKPDLIFLDILLPGENGLEVLKKLKKDPATKPIPTVLFTNLSDKISRKKSKEMGAAGYFVKTDISLNDLVGWAKEHVTF